MYVNNVTFKGEKKEVKLLSGHKLKGHIFKDNTCNDYLIYTQYASGKFKFVNLKNGNRFDYHLNEDLTQVDLERNYNLTYIGLCNITLEKRE